MLRFAPSQTKSIDLSGLRVAIFNYIISKKLNEDLVIRIEDIDKDNIIEGKDKEILEILNLFSIEYKGVIYQNESLKYHQKLAMQLMAQKKAFSCFCSEDKIQELKDKAEKKGKVYSYDGFCETLSDETVLNTNAPFCVRIKKPEDSIKFTDSLKGDFSFKHFEVDYFEILNHDKTPTYNYACAVDDMIMNISTIIRDEQYLENTPKQIHVRDSLGYDKQINYIHLPKVNSTIKSVKQLIDDGFLPSAIANYLVLLGNETPKEIFSLEEAIQWFDIKKISQARVEFDLEELKAINQKHLEMIEDMRLSKILGFADTDIGKLGKLFLNEVSTIKQIKEKIDLIFSDKYDYKGSNDEFNKIKESLKKAPYFENLKDLEEYLSKETNLDNEQLSKPLKYILTKTQNGPDISHIYPLIKNYIGEIVK